MLCLLSVRILLVVFLLVFATPVAAQQVSNLFDDPVVLAGGH